MRDKNISKKIYMVGHGQDGKELFRETKMVHIEMQKSSYLLSKCLKNLFSGLLEGQKCQIEKCFFSAPNIVETNMEVLPLLVIHLFK